MLIFIVSKVEQIDKVLVNILIALSNKYLSKLLKRIQDETVT